MSEYLYYKSADGRRARVRPENQAEFERNYPDAKIYYNVKGQGSAYVPISNADAFKEHWGADNVSYGVVEDWGASSANIETGIEDTTPTRGEARQARREERQNDGKTTFGETLGKSAAAAGVRTGKLALDLARAAWNTGVVGGAINFMTGKKFDEKLRDEDSKLTQWSMQLGETADRLSREADPTGGEKGYVDLIKEGNIGQLAQKALASGIESLPMMAAAGTPWGMLLYGAGMAAGEYSDETRENPDIPSWKRAINSMGSAALEMAVEKIGGPLNDLGKAGKEITEDMAKEILETAVKEGSDHIAKRIVKKLGTMVKQGAEEGVEEVVTSFGNDVLGTSLDLIDGDADYGIQAQWNQLKEQNPDASLADFAKEKGKEYMDAFIGGAVSGLEISTTTEGLGAGVNALRNNESRNIMEHAREVGSSMNYDDLYDTDSDVANAKTAVANSFADKDGNPTISNEFIESLSAEDAYALAGREDFSYQQRRAFGELAIAKAKSDALNGRLDTMRDERVSTIRSRMEKASENGQIVTGMVDGRVVYVRGGKVNNREVSVDKHGGHGPLLVIDSVTGEEKVVNSKDITSASVLNAEETINGMVNFILNNEASDRQTARTTMSKRAKIAAVNEFIGKRMMINSENGIIEVEVTASPQSGKVLIKGKKGDLGGQAIKPMDADVFYDSIYRNENGEPIFVEKGEVETEEVEVEVPETPIAPEVPVAAGVAEDDDFRDFTGTILVDGAPLNVSVISQDGPSDTIVYEYEDENGNTRRASTTIGAFKTAVQQGAEYAPEAPVVTETPVVEAPVAEEVPPTEETPTAPEAPVEVELGPDDIDWDALFDSDPEAYFVELQKQFGDGAIDMLTAVVEATQEELDGINKNKGKTQKEIFANVTKKKALQNKIDILNGMIERLTAAPAPETAPEVVPEPAPDTETVTETPPAEPVEEPAPVAETPKFETPEGGFIMEDGYIVNPIVIEMPGVEGESNKIYLAEHNGKWGVAQYAVMDNGNSSGSEKNGRVQKEVITYDTPEEAIVKALKYFDFYRKNFGNKQLTSAKIDAFMQWIKDTYLKDSGLDVPEAFVPVAPNPVDDPIKEAKKREKSLATQLKRIGIPHEQKQDMAFNAGKAVADMFATREEYEEYAEDATDFGEYNADFERGVEFSFANRPQNPDDTPGKSVPLENEPKEGENGGETDAPKGDDTVRPADGGTGGGTDNGGSKAGDKGNPKAIPSQGKGGSEGGKESGKVKHQYPARKGNVTGKILIDTFGLAAVDIPNSRKEILNTFYDFMMEMSKILGISPKSIGNGGWLTLGNLRSNARAFARHIVTYQTYGRDLVEQYLLLKYSRVSSIAHEWWHSLDHALSFFDKGKSKGPTTEIATGAFDGRQETLEAVRAIMQAIRDSGYTSRIQSHPLYTRDFKNYVLEPTESAARAFAEYMRNKFAENGIAIAGVDEFYDDTQPTAEEMKLITPAIENLFKVLKEKEGKTPGTSILFQIEKELKQNDEVKQDLGRLVADWIQQGGNFVVMDTEAMRNAIEGNAEAQMLSTPDGIIYGFVKDGVVYLDPTLINPNTAIHEYTHLWDNALMQLNSPLWEKGKALMKQTSLWNEVINDPNYADIKDDEDLVASEVHSRLVGTKGAEKLNQLEQEAKAKGLSKGAKELSILGKLKEWLNEATQWLKDAFSGVWSKEDIDNVTLTDFLNMPLRDLANFKALPKTGEITNESGEVVADNNGKGRIQFSISTWENGGRDYLVDWLSKDETLAEDEKADILARMDEFYDNAQKYTDVYVPFGTWSEAAVKYDKDGNPLMSVIKANGDYAMNLDFSLVCKKRRPLNTLLRELIRRNAFATYTLRERELAEINWILQDHGFEVACALCFVDSKRFRVTGVADVFATLYNNFVKALAPEGAQIAHFNYSNNPNVEAVEGGIDSMPDEQLNWNKFDALAKKYGPNTVEGKVARFLRENPSQRRLVDATDFIDSKGFEAVKEGNPALLSLYNSKKGTGGPKASFGDVQYLNDILKKDKAFDVDKAYSVGGVRLQSFSDFVPHMYFDYMQLFAELAAKKLPAHAYTKEVLFAKIFGMSGIKVNMSLVPSVVDGGIAPGLDANGNYTWADAVKDADGNVIQQAQSFPYDEAMAIQNAEGYSKNCGVIAVGISDEHIEKMLDDPNITFIIPYHKSSLNAIVARMTNIDKYKDYTKVQNTRQADGSKLDKGTPDFNFNAYLREHEGATPQQAAQAYLDWCKENNYIPKFSQFTYHQNYYKLLQDFNTYDVTTGEYAPQGAVTMTFPTKESPFGDVETLIQQGLAEDATLEEKMETEMSQVADEVEARLKEIAKEPKVSKKKHAEQMAQLADERTAKIKEQAERKTYASPREEKAAIKAAAIADGTFMKAPNGEPTKLTEDQWLTVRTQNFINWFGDWMNDPENASKVVDENGEPMVVYHGSPYGAITQFDRRGHSVSGLREFGTYFSTSKELAQLYAYARQQAKGDVEKYELEKARLDAIIFDNETPARIALDAFDELDRLEESQKPRVYEVFLNIRKPKVFDAERSNGWDGWHKLKQDVGYDIKSGVEAIEAISGHNSAARMNETYDGIIAENMADVHSEEGLDELMGDVFLVFDETPSNIKSATSNAGTFDPLNPDIRYRKSEAQNAAVDYLVGEPRLRAIENAVNEEASKLGVKVTYKTREQMPEGHKNDKGYYDTKTGEIVICTENASSIADAIQTILHEAVAHKGLRQLMGDAFDEFISRVYDSLDAETKAKVDAIADKHYAGDKAVAMEEYMATLAETTDFADNSVWGKIKSIFENIINAILGRNDIKIGDNELRYILRASYNNMVNPRNMETVRGWAQDQMMREEYKINEATPDILSRTGIDPDEVARETAKAVYERIINENWQEFHRQFQDAMQPVRIAIDAIQQETGNLPIEDYENFLLMFNQASSRSRVEIDDFSRRYYSPIIEQVNRMIDMIMEKRGWNVKDQNRRAEVYAEVRQYLIAKHGLERNKYYQETKVRLLNAAEKKVAREEALDDYNTELARIASLYKGKERKEMEEIAKTQYEGVLVEIETTRTTPDLRDYAGLTALFGYDPTEWEDAEAEAQRFVDEFERGLGRVDRTNENGDILGYEQSIEIIKLWEKINKATDKTLRHSYESGLISRSQYEFIKSMFGCYIPLRGFDETTAEDVYSYARFEGNRFNPAVHKVKGRTSVADDPLAIIMNMAESEIAQGNKNRAKQALYNFLLNRPVTGMDGSQIQNSLMQVEDVWYIRTFDENGDEVYTIATPDHESGETYEEFEERMRALEGSENSEEFEDGEEVKPRTVTAFKSKKGKLNVGMRFQKPANINAHYVFLKVNGVEKAIYINGDPKAAQAINGEHKKQRGALAEKMGILNRFISSMFTNYSLEFTARNYFRDMFYSHINIDVKESDPAYRKKFRQNWRHNNLRSMVKMLKAYRAGEYEGRDLNEDEKAFVEFMRNGGQTGYTLINSVETHKKDLERAIANMQKGIEKGGVKDSTIFKFTLGSIELLNEASELVTRFAAFKTSRDMGRGINTSIADAKEVTVNFNTKGAQDGKGFMGMIAHYFGWSKYFFNASVQGVQNLKSMAEANKLKFGSVIGGMVATGFLMPVITSAIASLFGNDDEEYWNIPEYERQNNFCVPIGNGKYVKVPLPIGFREVYAIGDMVAGAAFNKKFTRDLSQVGTDIANKLASIILPINPLESTANGLGFWHMFAYTTLPSFAQVAVQNLTNTDWKGAPLQKEYTYNEDDPQWMKAFASNPDWMKGLSKWCNEHINLDGDYKGMDWSPEQLDNTLSNVFGGIYSLVKKTGKSISMIWNEENRNLSNIPLSGVVLGSGIDNDDRFVTDAYYDMKEYYDSNVNYIKRMAKRFGYTLEDVFEKEKGKHHPKMNEIYSNENFDFMQEWYTGVKELDAINDKIKKLDKKIAAKETPTEQDMLKWSRLNDKYMTERRDFVNDMLELD